MSYIDFLIRIKNASQAGKKEIQVPFSKLNFEIAKILVNNKYLKNVNKTIIDKKSYLNVDLNYPDNKPAILDIKLISKPSGRVYFGAKKIKSVKQGFGSGVFSTSSGLMTDREARKNKIGGEYLFQIW